TNDFSAAGPSNAAASPIAANSSSQDASTSTHDSDMLNLEDLTHSDDANDVGAEADINNLESIISTRSMARAVRDQGAQNSFLGEYECSSLALDNEERRDEKKRLDHLKQDQIMSASLRYETGVKKLKEVDFISQGVELVSRILAIMTKTRLMVSRILGGNGGESFWEGGDDFRVDVLHFHTCRIDILGFLEKF
nr:hypothetical protein [Tanacetum cinerariifolium]